jgi:hypothetical protein
MDERRSVAGDRAIAPATVARSPSRRGIIAWGPGNACHGVQASSPGVPGNVAMASRHHRLEGQATLPWRPGIIVWGARQRCHRVQASSPDGQANVAMASRHHRLEGQATLSSRPRQPRLASRQRCHRAQASSPDRQANVAMASRHHRLGGQATLPSRPGNVPLVLSTAPRKSVSSARVEAVKNRDASWRTGNPACPISR